jgi:hypothetical protein
MSFCCSEEAPLLRTREQQAKQACAGGAPSPEYPAEIPVNPPSPWGNGVTDEPEMVDWQNAADASITHVAVIREPTDSMLGTDDTDLESGDPVSPRTAERLDTADDDEYEEIDLPGSVYGAGIFGVAHDLTIVLNSQLPESLLLFRCVHCLGMLLVNYVVQGYLLLATEWYVVLPAVHSIQSIYAHYHKEAFDVTGVFLQERWNDPEIFPIVTKMKLCQIPLSHPRFTLIIVFVWTIKAVAELKETMKIFRDIQRMEGASRLSEVLTYPSRDGRRGSVTAMRGHIRRLTPMLRGALHAVITIPKLVLNCILFLYGTRWLVATTDFAGLVLNSVALSFIVEIDELIYATLLPLKVHEAVDSTKLLAHQQSEEADIGDRWTAYTRAWLFFAAAVFFGFAYINYSQYFDWDLLMLPIGVLPGYQFDLNVPGRCDRVIEEMSSDLCKYRFDAFYCFPYGAVGK